jgi:two-component sensor histidine kinase
VEVGRVEVHWRRDGETFAMRWTESQGPPVQPPVRSGFGRMVIEAMAKHAVGAEVRLDYAPSGLQWHLVCPAANAMEQERVERRLARQD